MDYESVVNAIEPPDYKEKQVKKYQSTNDIIKDLIFCFKEYNHQAKPIAEKFGTGSIKTDAKNIYDFLKRNIKYDAEPEKDQTTRSFSRIIHDKWGDCKHTASIVGAIGWNEGYNVIFRVVRYIDRNGDYLYHVYTILENKYTGKRIIVDPLQEFNYEKPFDKKIGDYKAQHNMTLTRLTGTQNMMSTQAAAKFNDNARVHHSRKKHLRKCYDMPHQEFYQAHQISAIDHVSGREILLTPLMDESKIGEIEQLEGIGRRTKSQRREHRKKLQQKIKKGLKRGGTVFKKVSLAPVRGAMSALLLINFMGFATRLQQAINMGHGAGVSALAKKFGYSDQIFKSQIRKGSTKKAIGAIDERQVHNVEGIGIIATAAAITTAAPAIIAIVDFLKKLGLGKHSDEKATKDAADDLAKTVDQDRKKDLQDTGSDLELPMQPKPKLPSDENNPIVPMQNDRSISPPDNSGGSDSTEKSNYVPPANANVPADSTDNSGGGIMDTIKNLPTPVIVVGSAAIIYFGGKALKIF